MARDVLAGSLLSRSTGRRFNAPHPVADAAMASARSATQRRGNGIATKQSATPANAHDPDAWMTSSEVAKFCNVSERTLADWRRKNKGPKFTRLGPSERSNVRYIRRDVIAYGEANKRTPAASATLNPLS